MALIKCPECGKEVSNSAKLCPNCGFPIAQRSTTPEPQYKPQTTATKKKKKGSFSNYLALVCAIFIVVYLYSNKPEEKVNTANFQHKKTETSYGEKTTTPTPIEYAEVSVNRMMAELENNALSASEKYEDKYLEITGKLDVIDSSGKYISLYPDNKYSFVGVQCYIKNEEQKQKVSSMIKGDTVTLKGKCTRVGEVFGYSLDIDEIE